MTSLARRVCRAAYVYSILRLPWLAPDITTAIINGRKPPHLTAKTLMRLTPGCRPTGPNSESCSASAENGAPVLLAVASVTSVSHAKYAAQPAKKVNPEKAPERFSRPARPRLRLNASPRQNCVERKTA
jgi:hypothetical protein